MNDRLKILLERMSSLSQNPKTAHDGKAEDFTSKPEEPSEA